MRHATRLRAVPRGKQLRLVLPVLLAIAPAGACELPCHAVVFEGEFEVTAIESFPNGERCGDACLSWSTGVTW